jgi:hypothetical protein
MKEAAMSGQSANHLRELLAMTGEFRAPNDAPRIPADDALLEALRLYHGPDGRPDEAPQLAAARDLLKQHNLASYRRLASS